METDDKRNIIICFICLVLMVAGVLVIHLTKISDYWLIIPLIVGGLAPFVGFGAFDRFWTKMS